MKYSDSKDDLDTARKILKVNHAGEFDAINIYKAQIRFVISSFTEGVIRLGMR